MLKVQTIEVIYETYRFDMTSVSGCRTIDGGIVSDPNILTHFIKRAANHDHK